MLGQLIDQRAGQFVQSRTDAMAFSSTLLPQESSGDTAVVSLLASNAPTATHVPKLDLSKLRKADPNIVRSFRGDFDPVERGLVGIEGDEGGWGVGERRGLRIDEHNAIQPDVNLSDPTVRAAGRQSQVVRNRNDQRGPLPGSNGEPEFPGL
jgi:hypothetical protein